MIIITGAAGFIGSCILSRFNSLGVEEILIVDNLNDPLKEENLKGKKFSRYLDKKEFIEIIRNNNLNEPIKAIIHMGACSSTTLNDESYYRKNNFEYSRQLAQWCLSHNARFIYASSAATYGSGALGYCDDDETTRKCQPLNFYGQSKQDFDMWCLDNGLTEKFVGLKFFNVFGPNEYHKKDMRSVICKAYQKVASDGKMALFKSYREDYGDGEQKRDFIYVKDAVDIVMFFYDRPKLSGIYNAGTGKARSWNDLARGLFKAARKDPAIEYVEMPEKIKPKYQYFTQADMTKLESVGFKIQFAELEDSIMDYVSYLEKGSRL